jgi:hypothetical protein
LTVGTTWNWCVDDGLPARQTHARYLDILSHAGGVVAMMPLAARGGSSHAHDSGASVCAKRQRRTMNVRREISGPSHQGAKA